MPNITSVTVTSGVPTAGTGTVSTLDGIINATNGPVDIKAASTPPVATDKALVVAISPNSVNTNVTNASDGVATSASASAPVVNYNYAFNGTTWDRQQADANKNTKVTPQATTAGGMSRSRTLIPNNTTAVVVKASAGQVYKIRATNNSAAIAYIKVYDATTATSGSGTPVDTIMIPAATSGGAGVVDGYDIGVAHATGITFIVTTGIADADTTAPAASAYVVTVFYK